MTGKFKLLATGALALAWMGSVAQAQEQVPAQADPGHVLNWNLYYDSLQRTSPWLMRPVTEQDVRGLMPMEAPLIQGYMRDPYGRIIPVPGVPAPDMALP